MFCTSDSPPPVPASPSLREAGVTSLTLGWDRRPVDDDYTLQMEDKDAGYGFLPVYNGKETVHTCHDLRHHTTYKFRVSGTQCSDHGLKPASPENLCEREVLSEWTTVPTTALCTIDGCQSAV